MSARFAAASLTLVLGAGVAFALSARQPRGDDGTEAAPTPPRTPAAAAPSARTVALMGHDNMTFSEGTITAAPDELLTVALRTETALPTALVHHNFVLLPPTVSPVAFTMLAAQSHAHGAHVPEGFASQVIAATPVANAGETVTTTFRAPSRPGRYVYLCSVPGHFGAGMKGVLEVESR
jgi:azurin